MTKTTAVIRLIVCTLIVCAQRHDLSCAQAPKSSATTLPNGWHITPAGKPIATLGDLITNLTVSPDGAILVAVNSGYSPHALTVFDTKTQKRIQRIELRTTWLGMTWSPDGHTLFVSGGNASGAKHKADPVAAIYEFTYANGRLSEAPVGKLTETIDPKQVWWSGVAYLATKHWLYAANRGTGSGASNVVVFDTKTREVVTRIPVEASPYQTVLTPDGKRLFVSNWSSESVSVIDTETNKVINTLHVGMNPNDMKLSSDGRLFVACSNDNTVSVIDIHTLQTIERLSTTQTPLAPEGSTPNAFAIDNARHLLYVANADNNSVAVADIGGRRHARVVGFIPTGWYPSALVLADQGNALYVGASRGEQGHANLKGPLSPLVPKQNGTDGYFGTIDEYIGALQTSAIEMLSVKEIHEKLPQWTRQVVENTPYKDSLLSEARPPRGASIIPQQVGASSPIEHVIYIIKENRTYDQVFGDLAHANGDARLTIFGEKVTPNQHALAKEYVILDNLYCDGEVSYDGHSWSTAAYATDFNQKQWPSLYGEHTEASGDARAVIPSAGRIWDIAGRKGLTYRNYGEYVMTVKHGGTTESAPAPGMNGLEGHVAKDWVGDIEIRDTEKLKIFLRDLKQYDEHFDSQDPEQRLPNLTLVRLPEDHTAGTDPGYPTPSAMVASNDHAIGQLVDAVSHSKYWPTTAIFIIEDDAQDGPDHVDARRTVGLVISPYVKRGIVDSTLYTTSSMLRSIELLLGLPPMSQYDAAAMPMYASFGTSPVSTPFTAIAPLIDVNVMNTKDSPGAKESSKMDFSGADRAPMHALNEIIWKSVKGEDSAMPPPVHRFRPLIEFIDQADKDGDRD